MNNFRVFLSYARADKDVIESVCAVLNGMGLTPQLDADIPGGTAFDDAIRRRIARAHVFMPLLTMNSCKRPWVHQEIGYALGIGVPVLPVAAGALPEGMLSLTQAIRVKEDLSDLQVLLGQTDIEALILSSHADGELERLGITTHLADFSEERTRMLVRSTKETSEPAIVRQRAIFSSFSLPNAQSNDPIWDTIDLPEARGRYLRTLLRDERATLENNAQTAGCSLILYPSLDWSPVGREVHRAQFTVLKQFLNSMPNDKIRVAIVYDSFPGSLTIIGDWFGVKALPPQPGSEYRQSVFCHHAPTVLRWVRDFDRELMEHLRRDCVDILQSRDYALQQIDERLSELGR